MNKWQKELLDKCKEVTIDEDVPLLDTIYILPTTKRHESQYKIMYVVGKAKDDFYLLDRYCDVVDIGEIFSRYTLKNIHIDIPENGIIRLWNRSQKFKSTFRLSSCTFEVSEKR